MKKIAFSLLLIGIATVACKKNEPIDYGTMSIAPKEAQEIFYDGDPVVFSVKLSPTGKVNETEFDWSVSDDNVLQRKAAIGNQSEIRGNRIGEAYIRYISRGDQRYKDSVKITVKPRQLFQQVFFKKGANLVTLTNELGKSADRVNGDYYYFKRDVTTTQIFSEVIYQFKNDGLIAAFAVLDNNTGNQTKISEYVNERFRNIGDDKGVKSMKNVIFYDANAAPLGMYEPGVIIGTFMNNVNLISGETLPLGIAIANTEAI